MKQAYISEEKENIIDLKVSIALIAPFVVLSFQYLVLILFDLMDTMTGTLVQSFSKLIVACCYIYAFPAMWKRSSSVFLIAYGIAIFIFSVQFIFFIPNRPFIIDLIFPTFFMSLPAFIFTMALRDLSKFQYITKIGARIIFFIGVIIAAFVFSGNASVGDYSMSLSYYMLLPALFFLKDFLNKYSLFSLCLFIIALIIILSLGSRGPLLCIVVFGLMKLVRLDFVYLRKAILFRMIVSLSLLVVFIKFQNILSWLSVNLEKIGISSRTINLFQQEELHLSGRDNILIKVIEEIKFHPLTGIGLAGDRIITGTYSHNFFIEFISGFGVIIGLITVTIMAILFMRILINADNFTYDFISFWLCLGFIHLMVSGTYLNELKFWMFIGIIILLNFILKERKLGENEQREISN